MIGAVAVKGARGVQDAILAYVRLTKPRIISLLLVTTIPAMILAEGGVPSPWLVLVTLVGGALVAGGANAMNCYFDRDIDALMLRTQGRPLPAGVVEPDKAAMFAVLLACTGFLLLETFTNLLAASLTVGALAFYVVGYTLLLKRTTPQNIVIGGAAGAVPPMVGWVAVTGEISVASILLFAIVFFWTPPHFWALAFNYRSDYKRAGVPMMPVVSSEGETVRHMTLHAIALVCVSLLLVVTGVVGVIYLVAAAVLGAAFLAYTFRLWRDMSARATSALFRFSIMYLALLFCAMAVDGLVRA